MKTGDDEVREIIQLFREHLPREAQAVAWMPDLVRTLAVGMHEHLRRRLMELVRPPEGGNGHRTGGDRLVHPSDPASTLEGFLAHVGQKHVSDVSPREVKDFTTSLLQMLYATIDARMEAELFRFQRPG